MNRQFNIIAAFVICCLLVAANQRDNSLLTSLKSALLDYLKESPREKLYLHISQPFYATGDHVWYKVYQVDAATNQPRSLSRSVYIQLIDYSGNEVINQIVKMSDGVGQGDFVLEDSLPTGVYSLRASTNWMLNFKTSALFNKNIPVINLYDSLESRPSKTNKLLAEVNMELYPEGGTLISNNESRIAFMLTNQNGVGLSATGQLLDDQNQLVSEFETLSRDDSNTPGIPKGLGELSFIPRSDRVYKARVLVDNMEFEFELPPVSKEGVQLIADKDLNADILRVLIRSTNMYNGKEYLLTINSGGEIIYHKEGKFANELSLDIPLNELKYGINQIALFDSFGKELSKRLAFKAKPKVLASMVTNKVTYGPREKVEVTIQTRNSDGILTPANISLAVASTDQLAPLDDDDISSHLLLDSELRRNLQNQGFYLSNHQAASEALELMLLANQSDQFDWSLVRNSDKTKRIYQREEGFSLHGKIGLPGDLEHLLDRKSIVLSRVGSQPYFANQFIYDSGYFTFKELSFQGKHFFDIQVISEQKFSEQIKTSIQRTQVTENNSVPLFFLTKEMRQYVEKQRIRKRIVRDYFEANKTGNQIPSESELTEHFQVDDKRIMKDFLPFADMRDIIREILPNVKLRKNKKINKQELVIYDRESFTHTRKPVFMIDGVLEFNQEIFLNLDVDNIASIEVARSKKNTTIFGPYGWGGMIIIHTYDNHYRSKSRPNFTSLEIEGFHEPSPFPIPNTHEMDSAVPDLRSLIYWDPEIVTNEKGEAVITFYTSDELGPFKISVEGITSTGTPVSINRSFNVKRDATQ